MSAFALPSPAFEPGPQRTGLESLLARVAQGDQLALAEVYRATSARVFGLALKILRDRDAAEETTLDVFTQVWRSATSYRAARAPALAWLLLLTRTRAIDALRARRLPFDRQAISEPVDEVFASGPTPEEATASTERSHLVRVALADLPRGQREAIHAAFWGGYTHTEAAKALDLPLGTLKARIRAGMVALRAKLAEMEL